MSRNRTKRQWTQAELDAKLERIRQRPEFARFSFRGALLCNLEIRDFEFVKANFEETNFAGAKLHNVTFGPKCRFYNTIFVGVFAKDVKILGGPTGIIRTPKKTETEVKP